MIALVASLLLAVAPSPAAPPALPLGDATELAAPSPVRDATELAAPSPVRDSLTYYYVRQDARALRRLLRAAQTREEKLLVRYRLYPLTQDKRDIGDIPSDRGVTAPRELALISALWAYRASSGPAWRLPTYGRRSERILDAARARSARDPYVLLVRGQSLYYKPGVFGGDVGEAKTTFETLRSVLGNRGIPGLHPAEAEIWIWMCERKLDPEAAAATRQRLMRRRLPPLFRQFLQDPP